jgi:hypothetical protein
MFYAMPNSTLLNLTHHSLHRSLPSLMSRLCTAGTKLDDSGLQRMTEPLQASGTPVLPLPLTSVVQLQARTCPLCTRFLHSCKTLMLLVCTMYVLIPAQVLCSTFPTKDPVPANVFDPPFLRPFLQGRCSQHHSSASGRPRLLPLQDRSL